MNLKDFFAIGGTEQQLNNPKFDVKEFMTNFISDDEMEMIILEETLKINEFHDQTTDDDLSHQFGYISRKYKEKMIDDIHVEKVIDSKEDKLKSNKYYSNMDIQIIENRCLEIGRSQGYDLAYELAKVDYQFFEYQDRNLGDPTLRNRLLKIAKVRDIISKEDELIIDDILNKYSDKNKKTTQGVI